MGRNQLSWGCRESEVAVGSCPATTGLASLTEGVLMPAMPGSLSPGRAQGRQPRLAGRGGPGRGSLSRG